MRIFTIHVLFDGGCKPTNPGNKYGSYEVRHLGKVVLRKERFSLGWGTNNEAEFEALETCLKAVLADLKAGGLDPQHHSLDIFTDSMIVTYRMTEKNKRKTPQRSNPIQSHNADRANAMADRAGQCLALCEQFHTFGVQWQGREANLATFGH